MNWRTKQVIEMTEEGEVVRTFTHASFQEPIALAVEATFGHILVADNGACCVFVFDSGGKPLFQVTLRTWLRGVRACGTQKRTWPTPTQFKCSNWRFGVSYFQVGRKGSGPGCFSMISGVAAAPSGEILVAENDRVHVFTAKGDFLETLTTDAKGAVAVRFSAFHPYCPRNGVWFIAKCRPCFSSAGKGRIGGLACDSEGRIVATRVDKARSYVHVLSLKGQVVNTLDSHDAPLKRPCGLAVTSDQHVVVVDLGNDTVSKYRYW